MSDSDESAAAATELRNRIYEELKRLSSAVDRLSLKIDNGISMRLNELQRTADKASDLAVTLANRVADLEGRNTWLWRTIVAGVISAAAGLTIYLVSH